MAEPGSFCVVIPAYNEAARVADVVRRARAHADHVIVVDDGSADATSDRAREAGADVVRHETNLGKGAAVSTGFRRAREAEFTWVVVMDADGQHDAAEIPALLRVQVETNADVVVGTRMANPVGMPLIRRWTNRFTSSVVSRLAGQKIPDSQSGFRLYRVACLDALELKTSRFDAESEILIELARRGASIASAPIRSIYADEVSKIHPWRDTVRFFGLVRRYLRAGKRL